jgi:hypothetical protein
MIFDTNIDFDRQRAITRFNQLVENKRKIELTDIIVRTNRQNNYLHLIISWFAIEYSDKLDYCKREFYKKTCNKELFEYEKTNKFTGEITKEYKSSSELTKEQMTLSITRFRNWSSENGIYLPSSDEQGFLQNIEFEIRKHKEFL